jgi:S-formylglutathione hydrolase
LAAYDAVELLKHQSTSVPILVDQGEADPFLKEQLKPETLQAVAINNELNFTLRLHAGYDHSYYFIQSFINDHLEFHEQYLKG